MHNPTAVVFDLDDTLYAERRFALSGYADVAQVIARETGIPAGVLYRFLVHRFRAKGREGLLQAMCARFALPVGEIPTWVAVVRAHQPRLRLPAVTRDVLRRLRADGHRLGILTNGIPSTQRAKVDALGLAPLVDVVVCAHEHAPDGKPAAVCFLAVLRHLGVEPRRAVFVGDHPQKDVEGARAVGMGAIRLASWSAREGNAGADARTLADVPGLVDRLLEVRHVGTC